MFSYYRPFERLKEALNELALKNTAPPALYRSEVKDFTEENEVSDQTQNRTHGQEVFWRRLRIEKKYLFCSFA